ncbi:HesA/MoeB/ThiF family protein [[Eubacterium] cellulosolvens]
MNSDLTDEELEYYSRQIAHNDIGYKGQLKLKNSKVCILGCGGLGVPTMQMLTAMGVGHIRIVDRDIISISDLHRQYLYDTKSIGLPKVEVASGKLKKINPHVKIEPLAEPIIKRNVSEIIDGMDITVDGLDSIDTRYLVNRACQEKKIPYVFAGAIESIANATTIIPDKTPCLECIFPGFNDKLLPKCSLVGVHPAVIGMISSVQVSEVTAILLGRAPQLAGKLLLINLNDLSFDKIDVSKQKNCNTCGSSPIGSQKEIVEKYLEEECARDGRRTIVLTPKKKIDVDLEKVTQKLIDEGKTVKVKGDLGITFDMSEMFTMSLLQSGLAIVQISPKKDNDRIQSEILSVYEEIIVDLLGHSKDVVPDA